MRDRSWTLLIVALGALAGACGSAEDAGAENSPDKTGGTGGGDFGGAAVGAGSGGSATNGGGAGAASQSSSPEARADAACDNLGSEDRVYYLSADDSASMASPAHVRELLNAGKVPLPSQVKTHEFLNYYNVRYQAPEAGGLQITPQAIDVHDAQFRLVIGVQAPAPAATPVSLTFVVDTSTSMGGESLARVKAALTAVAGKLSANDQVSLLTWSHDDVRLDGAVVSGPGDQAFLSAIEGLVADGSSDIQGGLDAGYALAREHYLTGATNRLVLFSDGGVNTAAVDRELIEENAADADQAGIYLVGVATGPAAGHSDAFMDLVTEAGRGSYVYLDSQAEAGVMFGPRFDEVIHLGARDVRLELRMPPSLDIDQFYGEEYSADPAAIRPQHLAAGDAMVFDQVVKSCLSLSGSQQVILAKVTWLDASGGARAAEVPIPLGEIAATKGPEILKAKAIVAYAEALKSLDSKRLQSAWEDTKLALAYNAEDPDLTEIKGLIEKHPGYAN